VRFLPRAQEEVELHQALVVPHRREARDLDRVRPDLLGDAVPLFEEGNETVDVGGVLDSNSHGGLSSLVSAPWPAEGSLRTRDFRAPKWGRTRAINLKRGSHVADLNGRKVAFLATDMVEQVELTEPWKAVQDAGGSTELLSLEEGEIQGFNHYDKAEKFAVDRKVEDVGIDDYDALVIPGGVGNPDTMRADEDAVRFVREFFEAGKPMAVICHGPWMLVEAGVLRGRRLTSFWSIKTDVENAGGNWVDEEVVVDGNLVTSRNPDDLPAFNEELVELFARAPVAATAR
jgi:protease I